jgi:hypothetical protein
VMPGKPVFLSFLWVSAFLAGRYPVSVFCSVESLHLGRAHALSGIDSKFCCSGPVVFMGLSNFKSFRNQHTRYSAIFCLFTRYDELIHSKFTLFATESQ